MENIEKCTKAMTMKNFTIENKDDINSAIDGLGQFCHSFCMNCEETEKTNDLVFRCKECPFEDKETRKCRVKIFLNKYGTPEQIDKSTLPIRYHLAIDKKPIIDKDGTIKVKIVRNKETKNITGIFADNINVEIDEKTEEIKEITI